MNEENEMGIYILRILRRYKWSVLSAMAIITGWILSFHILKELNPIIASVGGLLFSVPLQLFWRAYMAPILRIKKIEYAIFHLGKWEYKACRIIVENEGRSTARNCKGYIIVGRRKERVCWTVPKERPNATINAKDDERLDFCAFYQGPATGDTQPPKIIAPTEEGWSTDPYKCRKLELNEIKECKCLITADNADPVEANIVISVEKEEIKIKSA